MHIIKKVSKINLNCKKVAFYLPAIILISACSQGLTPPETNKCPKPRTVYSIEEQNQSRKNLEKKGIPLSKKDFMEAIQLDDSSSVLDMIKLGIDLDHQDEGSDHTPLITAFYQDRTDIIELLIENGADVNAKGAYILAIRNENTELAKDLINNCANANILDVNGNSALSVAIDHGNVEIVELLIKKGADLNQIDEFGYSPLARTLSLSRGTDTDRFEIVKLFVVAGANVNQRTPTGWTPLISASHSGYYEIVDYLIQNDADQHAVTKKGESAISVASKQGWSEIVELLSSRNN